MSIEIKTGSLEDFFSSAKHTAKQLDQEQSCTPKHTVWVEPQDLMRLLKPERTQLVQVLRKEKRMIFSKLMQVLERSPASLNNDLKILSKYNLINIYKEPNAGHGVHRVIESELGDERIEFRVKI